jgi:hypothetical protein
MREAQKLVQDGAVENRWTTLLNEWVFRDPEYTKHAPRGDSEVDQESDIPWNEAHRSARTEVLGHSILPLLNQTSTLSALQHRLFEIGFMMERNRLRISII